MDVILLRNKRIILYNHYCEQVVQEDGKSDYPPMKVRALRYKYNFSHLSSG